MRNKFVISDTHFYQNAEDFKEQGYTINAVCVN